MEDKTGRESLGGVAQRKEDSPPMFLFIAGGLIARKCDDLCEDSGR